MNNLCCILNEWMKCGECDWISCSKCVPNTQSIYDTHNKIAPECPLAKLKGTILWDITGVEDPNNPSVHIMKRRKRQLTYLHDK